MKKIVCVPIIVAIVLGDAHLFQSEPRNSIFTEKPGEMTLARYKTGEEAAEQISGMYGFKELPAAKAVYRGWKGNMRMVNYDFTRQELFGKMGIFDIPDNTGLVEQLNIVDARIMEAGKKTGPDTTYKTTRACWNLNGCVVFVNGAAPGNMHEFELHDGDTIVFEYGFCGGWMMPWI